MRGEKPPTSILYLEKLFLKNEGEVKTSLEKQKLREFVANGPTYLARNVKFFEEKENYIGQKL